MSKAQLSVLSATVIAIILAAMALAAPIVIAWPKSFIPPSFLTHSLMLGFSLALSAWQTGGHLEAFGFCRGAFRLTPKYFVWVVPTAILGSAQFFSSRSGASPSLPGLESPLAVVLFVWIYASVCEEVFFRGFFQSSLFSLANHRVWLFRRWSLSAPVMLSGLLFGAVHVVVWPVMGPRTIPIMVFATLLGIVTGYYRERTSSLFPAILVHALFNVGGSLPVWILSSLLPHRGPA